MPNVERAIDKIIKITPLLFNGVLLLSVSATQLPFEETFEAFDGVTNGTINSQSGWFFDSGTATVQSAVVQSGSQALLIQKARVSHKLSSDGAAIWLHFQARCAEAPKTNPTVTTENTSLAFFVNTNLNLVVYSNMVPVELSARIQTNVWIRFDVYCDYNDRYWDLSMNGTNVVAGLPLHSSDRPMEALLIGNDSTSPVYIDQIAIADMEQASEVPDSDNDSIPDWWEQKYFGGVTNISPGAMSGNAGLTYLQAYIAGVHPIHFDPFNVSPVGSHGLSWRPLPGRLYSVYWTTNLLKEFTLLQEEAYPQGELIDSIHSGEASGFYRLKVRMQ